MKSIYNKLVRDKIPEIIRKRGAQCEVRVLEGGEYEQCLKAKLEEEVSELISASSTEDRIAEIADIYEVLEGIMEFYQITPQSVIEVKKKKGEVRGVFKERIFLASVEE